MIYILVNNPAQVILKVQAIIVLFTNTSTQLNK